MRRRGIPALLLLAACDALTPPVRDAGYGFALAETGEVFRWPATRLPVRYWVAPGAGAVADHVAEGIAAWRDQLLYREFDGVLVTDSAMADVVVQVVPADPPAAPLTPDDPEPSACSGVTSFVRVEPDTGLPFLDGQFRVTVTWRAGFADAAIANCLHRVVKHEVGHTVGLFQHSDAPGDLMWGTPTVADPTTRDRRTVERLYHTPASLAPPQ